MLEGVSATDIDVDDIDSDVDVIDVVDDANADEVEGNGTEKHTRITQSQMGA